MTPLKSNRRSLDSLVSTRRQVISYLRIVAQGATGKPMQVSINANASRQKGLKMLPEISLVWTPDARPHSQRCRFYRLFSLGMDGSPL
jgi:hypothetical protein